MIKAIINAIVVTMNEEYEVIEHGYCKWQDDTIIEIGKMDDFDQSADEILDAKGGILMPGMINTHTHLAMIPFRGLGDDCKDRLRRFLFPMEHKWMDDELIYLATRYAVLESLMDGVTCVNDMYFYEDRVVEAAKELGIRGIFAETIIDEGSRAFATSEGAIEESERLLNKYKDEELIDIAVAPHGTTTVSEKNLILAKELARKYNAIFMLHTAEMDYEMKYFEDNNTTPIQFMEQANLLDEKTLLIHCIHMSDRDIELVEKYNSCIAHCIGANTKAAKGVARVTDFVNHNITVGLGTDGPSSGNTLDVITLFKLFADFHKVQTLDRSAWSSKYIVELGTRKAAKAIGKEDIIGSIEVGKKADLVVLETKSVNMFPIYDPHSTIVYSANASNVNDVFVNGVQLVKDKKTTMYDLEKARQELLDKMNQTAFKPIQ